MKKIMIITFALVYFQVFPQNNLESDKTHIKISQIICKTHSLKDTISLIQYNFDFEGMLLKRTKYGKDFGDIMFHDFNFIDNIHQYSYKNKKLIEEQIWNTPSNIISNYLKLPSKNKNVNTRKLFSADHNKSLYMESKIQHIHNKKSTSGINYEYDKNGNNTLIIDFNNDHSFLKEYNEQNKIIKKTMKYGNNLTNWIRSYEYKKKSTDIIDKSFDFPNKGDTLITKTTKLIGKQNRLVEEIKTTIHKEESINSKFRISYHKSGIIKEIEHWEYTYDNQKWILSRIIKFDIKRKIKRLSAKEISKINTQLIRQNKQEITQIYEVIMP